MGWLVVDPDYHPYLGDRSGFQVHSDARIPRAVHDGSEDAALERFMRGQALQRTHDGVRRVILCTWLMGTCLYEQPG